MKQIRVALILIALSFSEVAVTILMTKYLGAALTYSLFAVPTGVGLVIQWFRWQGVKNDWAEVMAIHERHKHLESEKEIRALTGTPGYTEKLIAYSYFWVSLILLLVPGFVTDIIAFSLMLPSVHKKLSRIS